MAFATSMVKESGRVRTPLWCHDCRNDFEAILDFDFNGNHVVNCPHCNHEHCRVIKDGVVTSDRWDSRNGASGAVMTYTPTQVFAVYANSSTVVTGNSYFVQSAWLQTVSAS